VQSELRRRSALSRFSLRDNANLLEVTGAHTMSQETASIPSDRSQERSRLIDHFKRAYQIIVGLAITLACTKLFPNWIALIPDVTFWLFCIFFITVVPIFHGGDRSLDVKYLGSRPQGFWGRAAYVWDVYMLLITAIFFVKIAQAIPGVGLGFGGGTPPQTPQLFYEWMTGMLVFDVGVLVVDWIKSGVLETQRWDELRVYWRWIVLNLVVAFVCFLASLHPTWILSHISVDTIAFCGGSGFLDSGIS
jgi:hypothetical protein